MTPLILIGNGGHALACLDVIATTGKFKLLGYVAEENAGSWNGLPCLGQDKDLPTLMKECPNVFLGIGQIKNPDLRKTLVAKLKSLGAVFPVIISPKAHVSTLSHIAEGTIVMHGAHVGPGAMIGAYNILNTRSLIEHGSRTGDFVHVSTAAVVNGDVTIGHEVFVGSNSVLCHGINIPDRAFVQAGQFIGRKHAW